MAVDTVQSSIPEYNSASIVQEKISSAAESIKNLSAMVSDLIAELKALGEAPKQGEDESPEDYQKRVDAWQQKVDVLNRRLNQMQTKLAKTMRQLDKLQASDLPTAQRDDAQKTRAAVEEQIKNIQETTQALDTSGDDVGLSTDGNTSAQLSLKASIVKQEVDGSEFSFVSLAVVDNTPAPAAQVPGPRDDGLTV